MSFKYAYLIVSIDYSIPFFQREKSEDYLDPYYLLCLNCPLDNCYRDGMRDSRGDHAKMAGKELCPIEIAKRG